MITLLLSKLVSLPKNIHLFNMVITGKLGFSRIREQTFSLGSLSDFLEDSTIKCNIKVTKIIWKPANRLIASIIVNIGVLIGIIEVW